MASMSLSATKATVCLVAWSAAWSSLLGILLESRSDAKVMLNNRKWEARLEILDQSWEHRFELVRLDMEAMAGSRRSTEQRSTIKRPADNYMFDQSMADPVSGTSLRGPTIILPLPKPEQDNQEPVDEAVGGRGTLLARGRSRGRRLVGYYKVGTNEAGVICWSFSGANTEADMSSDYCRGSANMICQGCFMATDDANNKVLEVIKCSSARYKVGDSMTSLGDTATEITIINADADNTLTVNACTDNACSSPVSTRLMSAGDAVTTYCHTGGGDRLYFPSASLQASESYNFASNTITDMGQVQTIDIDGGTIDNTNINVGAGKTLDLTGGTLILDVGEVPATSVSGGTFTAGTYSFGASTITDLGTVTTVDIDGGDINNTQITIHTGKTLDVTKGTLSLNDGQIPANQVGPGTFHPGTFSLAGSTWSDLGSVTTVDVNGGTISGTSIDTSSINVGAGKTLDVSGGNLNLAGSQVPAGSVGPGVFGVGTYYFTGSTIGYSGQITWADINGGTVDGVNIGLTTQGYGLFTTVRASEKVGTSTGLIAAASPTSNTQCGTFFSPEAPLMTSGMVESTTITCDKASAFTPIVATAGPCAGSGEVIVLDVTPIAGSFTVRAKNIGASDCTGPYSVHWMVLGAD